MGRPKGDSNGPLLRIKRVLPGDYIVEADDFPAEEIERRYQQRLQHIRQQRLFRIAEIGPSSSLQEG